ncbi:MAG: alpha/beta fold hydrolase [Paludibacter sp.]|nr:alpha/beta fold hydrolase [Paludibacter sp.]
MKRNLFISLLLTISAFGFSQDITGDWNGALKVGGMQLRLVFHITKTDAVYSATMDSPDQGAKGIPMSKVTYGNQILTVEMAAANINYSGTFDNKETVTGTFNQGGQSFPLVLTRKAIEKVEAKRPQNPVKPYPYYSEEVTFMNVKDSIKLAGTLTLPKKEGKFPVVVMITGSGPQNRDEELMGHKPFLVIADYLTRNGIGVLRYDDRGCYESKGNFAKATTNDFATDVDAAVNYLKTRKDIDSKKIGLIGHSEGGIIAPIVASKNKSVSYIVLMAGTAIPGSELLLRQQDLIGRASGMKDDDLKTAAELNTHIYKLVDQYQNPDTLKAKISNYLLDEAKKHPDMKMPEGKTVNDVIELQLSQLMSPWMLNFIRYNPAPILEKVTCPVLAINGDKDLQVPANVNLPAIEKALKKGGNKKGTIKELPGLNHLFQECKTGLPTEYGEIEQTVSPVALETMVNWIKEVVH